MTMFPIKYCSNCGKPKDLFSNHCTFCDYNDEKAILIESFNELPRSNNIDLLTTLNIKNNEDKDTILNILTNNKYIVGTELDNGKWNIYIYQKKGD